MKYFNVVWKVVISIAVIVLINVAVLSYNSEPVSIGSEAGNELLNEALERINRIEANVLVSVPQINGDISFVEWVARMQNTLILICGNQPQLCVQQPLLEE